MLKSYNSANHSGGELEASFFREFHRTVQQSRVVNGTFVCLYTPSLILSFQMAKARTENLPESAMYRSIQVMYDATADDRGTVQALSKEVNEATEDGKPLFLYGFCVNVWP